MRVLLEKVLCMILYIEIIMHWNLRQMQEMNCAKSPGHRWENRIFMW